MAGAALLELACRRIKDLDRPAYVKNSELRYIAVNDAYARFFGKTVSEFIGHRSRELFDRYEEEDREDKERRALVFGNEEWAVCIAEEGKERSRVMIESFVSDGDRPYVLGIFELAAEASSSPDRDPDDAGLLRALLDSSHEALFLTDADNRLVIGNKAFFQTIGASPNSSLETLQIDISPDDRAEMQGAAAPISLRVHISSSVDRLCDFEGDYTIFFSPIVHRDGRQFNLCSLRNSNQATGSGPRAFVASQEVDELQADFREMLKALPVGVIILDENYKILHISDEFARLWSVPAPLTSSLEGKPFFELISVGYQQCAYERSETPEEIFAQRLAVLESGSDEPVELFGANGRRTLFRCRRLREKRILLTYTDITQIREREREAAEAQVAVTRLGELMHDVTQAIAQGMLIARNGVILLSNASVASILHVPSHYLESGMPWQGLFRFCVRRGDFGSDPRAAIAFLKPFITRGRTISLPPYLVEGRWVKVEASFTEKKHWVAIFTDVTEMKQKESDLQRLLTLSEAADRTKSEFLANMGHEIRTPMNGVLSMAELLSRTKLDARQRTFVDVIGKSGKALLTIINDILDFSKIETGDMKLRKSIFDPLEAAEDIATLLSAQAVEKNLQLLVRAAPDLPSAVIGDAGRFRQILTNLVGNAIKFTEHGHVLIDLAFVQGAGSEIMLVLRVEDTGIGIASDRLSIIFEKFSQADTSAVRRHEGTGLGLAITAGLVELFEGYIEVSSEVGEGSVFTAHLPLKAAPSMSARDVSVSSVAGARVLLIDGEEVSRRILAERLTFAQFDIVGAENGEIALAILEEAAALKVHVDAVIIDQNVTDGVDLKIVEAIRARPRFSNLPVILLASIQMSEAMARFDTSEYQTCLMKPVRANVLLKAVEDVVRGARASARPKTMNRIEEGSLPSDADQRSLSVDNIEILVAEDNEVNQIVFTQILQAAGFRFLVVGNGREAVQAWEEYRPQLILMDISMPVMNGLDATRLIRLREGAAGTRIPIIGVTAHARDADRQEYLAAGMNDYIFKPISPEILEEKIGLWMKSKDFPQQIGSSGSDAT
ncbi:response regulator [Oryzifoliimicrobium ureilyticus]|uniref:response regulator n=1 Tax=Oryzifoliimicrobium ureilyticus TaxID=3113724 RepID=UPI00307645CC